ncbi:hypothetical protein ACFZ8E_07570 [Methylobacterium sp. HMF5984]|uniref:hypothetical protein n=1 Tax=Methylobacterium sp. HMF5984 TaxID=3367370 RepID=UPI0038541854
MIRFILGATKRIAYLLVVTACILYGWNAWTRYVDHLETLKEQHVHQLLEPPYVHHGDKVPDNIVRPGTIIYVHNVYTRTERCSMAVANLLIGVDTDIVFHWTTFNNWLGAGTFRTDEVFDVPAWVVPGQYRIVKRTTATCGDKIVFFVNFDLPVEVRK